MASSDMTVTVHVDKAELDAAIAQIRESLRSSLWRRVWWLLTGKW